MGVDSEQVGGLIERNEELCNLYQDNVMLKENVHSVFWPIVCYGLWESWLCSANCLFERVYSFLLPLTFIQRVKYYLALKEVVYFISLLSSLGRI